MAGCFGGSDIDRWMERNLNEYLDEGEPGVRQVDFKLFKGKALLQEWSAEIPDDEGCYHEMLDTLKAVHIKVMKRYFNSLTQGVPTLFDQPRRGPHTYYNPETGMRYYKTIDKLKQDRIIEAWAALPKTFSVVRGTFNLLRMGKYSVVCNDNGGE